MRFAWKPSQRVWQYSLRTALILVTILCLALGIVVNKARSRRAAIRAIDELGGTYGVRIEGPQWMRDLVKDDKYFYHPVRISFGPHNQGYSPERPFTDHELTRVIDHIKLFSRFNFLDLFESNITDRGLTELRRLPGLEILRLNGTKITDAGIEYLTPLTSLQSIDLTGTLVTRSGATKLQQALPNCKIIFDNKLLVTDSE